MTVRCQRIGSSAYRWYNDENAVHTSTCIITAHGLDKLSSRVFAMQKNMALGRDFENTRLHFYTAHGYEVFDAGIGGFTGSAPADLRPPAVLVEDLPVNESQDYILFKYTNSDNFGGRRHNDDTEDYTRIRYAINFDPAVEIITIRNRGRTNYHGILLSDVLKDLRKNNISYTTIKCAFCRGGKEFPCGAFPAWRPRTHTPPGSPAPGSPAPSA